MREILFRAKPKHRNIHAKQMGCMDLSLGLKNDNGLWTPSKKFTSRWMKSVGEYTG